MSQQLAHDTVGAQVLLIIWRSDPKAFVLDSATIHSVRMSEEDEKDDDNRML